MNTPIALISIASMTLSAAVIANESAQNRVGNAAERQAPNNAITLYDERLDITVSQLDEADTVEAQLWMQLDEQGWQSTKVAAEKTPISAALQDELRYREVLHQLTQLNQQRLFGEAEKLAQSQPQWQNCQRIQWQWQDLRAEMGSGYGPKAKQKYQNLLNQCAQYNRATFQKMLGWSNASAHGHILGLYQQSTAPDTQLVQETKDNIRLTRLKQKTVSSEELSHAERIAKTRGNGQIAETLGWKYLDNAQPHRAQQWFEHAISWAGPSEKRVKGLLHSYILSDQPEPFTQTQQQYAKRFPSILELEIASGDDDVAALCQTGAPAAPCLNALAKKPSLDGESLALKGWKLYDLQRPYSAMAVFEQALPQLEPTSNAYTNARHGYILALEQAGFNHQAMNEVGQLPSTDTQYRLQQQLGKRHIISYFEQAQYEQALNEISQYEQRYGESFDLAELKAWSLFHTNRHTAALEIYDQLRTAYPMEISYQKAYQSIRCTIKPKDFRCKH
ncbi:tetratricopeptide repeat protein [Vibrio sp. SM6]|uniref:Tetratricopeptide repeat protein n=1 Tax=Vibrio agarilyticus TaxID=2726741 RepID=A0A7X8TQC1_9VIBR|nr:tetratricopeptide repeat protein [Vibrio agarilyticus]NLS13002.1 tetratricopeptide repeat protein [Vibrio agarilyticus]